VMTVDSYDLRAFSSVISSTSLYGWSGLNVLDVGRPGNLLKLDIRHIKKTG
jgi:hypothetical protein